MIVIENYIQHILIMLFLENYMKNTWYIMIYHDIWLPLMIQYYIYILYVNYVNTMIGLTIIQL